MKKFIQTVFFFFITTITPFLYCAASSCDEDLQKLFCNLEKGIQDKIATYVLYDTREDLSFNDTTLENHTKSIHSLCFNHDGTQLATVSNDRTARVWDPKTGDVLHVLQGHNNWIDSV